MIAFILRVFCSIHGASMSVTSPVLDVPAEATAQAATLVSTETPQVALARYAASNVFQDLMLACLAVLLFQPAAFFLIHVLHIFFSCTAPEDVVMEIDGLFTPLKALPRK